MRRFLALALALGGLALAVLAWRLARVAPGRWPLTPVAGAVRRPHLVLIAQEAGNPYWQQLREGAEEAARRLGVTLEYTGPARWNVKEHLRLLDMAVASRVDGILVQGLSEAFVPYIDKAVSRGIPVITVDTDTPSRRLAYVGTDNYASGRRAGETLVALTGGQAVVGIITGSLEAANQRERVQGFRDAVAPYPGIRIAGVEVSDISPIGAVAAAQRLLQQHPDITALVGTSAMDGQGAAQAVQTLGRRGKVLVMGYDAVPETVALLRSGDIHATVVQRPRLMGQRAVEMMVDVLAGRPVPPRVDTGVAICQPADVAARGGCP